MSEADAGRLRRSEGIGSPMPAAADIVTLWPRWMDSAGEMLRMNAPVRTRCSGCGTVMRADLNDIVARHGPGHSLVDRLERCRVCQRDRLSGVADLWRSVDDAPARSGADRGIRGAAVRPDGARMIAGHVLKR